MILVPIVLPALAGILLLVMSFVEHLKKIEKNAGRKLHLFVGVVLTLSVISAFVVSCLGDRSLCLCTLLDNIPIYFKIDALGRLFMIVVSIVW